MSLEAALQHVDIRYLGRNVDYTEAHHLQLQLQQERAEGKISDTILLLEHNDVYTMGTDEQVSMDTLLTHQVHVVKTDRGGKITYHGPGQLVGYLICKIPTDKRLAFCDTIEQLTIQTLQAHGIKAYSRKTETDAHGKEIRGAWVNIYGEHKKIAAQGIGLNYIGNGIAVTMHGFALNINTDLSFFDAIKACGFEGKVMTSMQEILRRPIPMEDVRTTVTRLIQEWKPYA